MTSRREPNGPARASRTSIWRQAVLWPSARGHTTTPPLAPNAQYSVVVEGAPGDLLVAIVNQVKLDSGMDNSSAYEGFGRTP